MFYVRSFANLPKRLELNGDLRFVGVIPGQDVRRYIDAGVHVFRSLGERWRLGVTGENLLHGDRTEWDDETGLRQPRSVRASLDWRF